MKNWIALALLLCTTFCTTSLYGQQVDPDFARRIRPEHKVDLNPQNLEMPTAHSKTLEEVKAEQQYYVNQKHKTEQAIIALEEVDTPKNDPQYVKYQLTLKLLNSRVAELDQKRSKMEKEEKH